MKSFARIFLRVFAATALAVSLMPLPAFAEDASEIVPPAESEQDNFEADSAGGLRSVDTRIESVSNPLTGGTGEVLTQVIPAQGPPSLDADNPTEFVTQAQAVDMLTEGMENRQTSIAVSLETDANYSSLNSKMFYAAMEEDGNPQHGDYLRWIWSNMRCSMTGYIDSDTGAYFITYTYQITYKTTAAQETTLMNKVDTVLNNMDLNGKSDYEKATAIHNYLCKNVAYDYTSYASSYKLQYTAYAAMMNGTAVCQGYASLFYLMAGKAGLSSRIIAGLGNGGDHAWNIVRLDNNLYYNLDATWDSQRVQQGLGCVYYLKSNADFTGHVRNSTASGSVLNYTSSAFNSAHPMSSTSWTGIPIQASNVTLGTTSYVYNGTVRTPAVTVTVGGQKLVQGTDYDVTYDSGRKRSGTYTVTVKGTGAYSGTVNKTFKIVDAQLEEDMVTLSYSLANYNGVAKVPTATVKVNGVSQYTSEYTVTYWNEAKSAKVSAVNVGIYWVKVTAEADANTTGSVWKKLTVRPKPTELTALTAQDNGFKATWTKRTVQCSGYQVYYKLTTADSWNYKNITSYSTGTVTISGLKDKKAYNVKVRTFKTVNDTKIYSTWSDTVNVTTK